MKAKVAMLALIWTLLVSGLHVHLNIGWDELGDEIRVLMGQQRKTMLVGFLPVT